MAKTCFVAVALILGLSLRSIQAQEFARGEHYSADAPYHAFFCYYPALLDGKSVWFYSDIFTTEYRVRKLNNIDDSRAFAALTRQMYGDRVKDSTRDVGDCRESWYSYDSPRPTAASFQNKYNEEISSRQKAGQTVYGNLFHPSDSGLIAYATGARVGPKPDEPRKVAPKKVAPKHL